MRLPGFVGPSSLTRAVGASNERTVNLMIRPIERGGKTQQALFPIDGPRTWATLPDSPGRGIFYENGRLFAVAGNTLYEILADTSYVALGDVGADSEPVTMSTNGDGGNELFITSAGNGYTFDLNTSTLTLAVADLTMAGQLDGFFVGLDSPSSTLKISESLDGLTWDPSQIAQRTAASDPWKALIIVRREIFLFGDMTSEVWYNRGTSPFPLAQRDGAFFDVGIAAKRSLAPFGNTAAWLGKRRNGSGTVFWLDGYTPLPISTPEVEYAIQTYDDTGGVSDAIGWSYEKEGHRFYVITFPTVGKTWVFDGLTNTWSERGTWDGSLGEFGLYRPCYHAHAFGHHLTMDIESGNIYELEAGYCYDVDSLPLRRLRRTAHMAQENKRLFFTRFELECERGLGLLGSGQGSNPQVMLRYSNDGGRTWGPERWRSMGARGQYSRRVIWDQCGSARDRVWELSATDPVPTYWLDAYVEAGVGKR